MKLYSCEGHRSIKAESLRDAGQRFADVKANRLGKSGTVATCQMDSWSQSGSSATFKAFVGTYDRQSRTTTGNDEWYYVSVAD